MPSHGPSPFLPDDFSHCLGIHESFIDPYRFRNVLYTLFPKELVSQRKLVFDLIEYGTRDADPSRVSKALYSGSYVDSIAIYTIFFMDHITKVDSNTKFHLAIFR
ncbi:MAG: hypothetical protein P8X67_15380 [Syntrophobacterales bacterium]